jgi:hypothetical protein
MQQDCKNGFVKSSCHARVEKYLYFSIYDIGLLLNYISNVSNHISQSGVYDLYE